MGGSVKLLVCVGNKCPFYYVPVSVPVAMFEGEEHTVMHGTLVYVWHTAWSWLTVAVGMYLKLECMGSQIQGRDTANLNSEPRHARLAVGPGPGQALGQRASVTGHCPLLLGSMPTGVQMGMELQIKLDVQPMAGIYPIALPHLQYK